MYTGPGRFTRAWRKVREIPPAVQGAAVVAVVVLAAVGAARSHDGSSGPDQILSPATGAPALDTTPSPEPSHSSFASSDDTPLLDDDATASPSPSDSASPSPSDSASPYPSESASPTSTAFMYSDCKAIKAAGRDPLSRGEYGYNPELDKDHDGVDCH
jgi:hypothetical protein